MSDGFIPVNVDGKGAKLGSLWTQQISVVSIVLEPELRRCWSFDEGAADEWVVMGHEV